MLARYLREQRIRHWFGEQYADRFPLARTRPDFLVEAAGAHALCEVRALHCVRPRTSVVIGFDQYRAIRRAIHESGRQFRDYRGEPCVLVLHNIDDWEFRNRPLFVFGAMLDDAGFRTTAYSAGARGGREAAAQHNFRVRFPAGGRRLRPTSREPRNTTFSAIAVLEQHRVPSPAFQAEFSRRIASFARRIGRAPTVVERLDIRLAMNGTDGPPAELPARMGVTIYENPLARTPLARELFRGGCDSRYQFDLASGGVTRIFPEGHGSDAPADMAERIEAYGREVGRVFSPERVILFGSHAYGKPGPGSDVDLLVIFAGNGDQTGRSLDVRRRVPCEFAVDVLTRSVEQVRRRQRLGDTFLHEILTRGKVLYEAPGA